MELIKAPKVNSKNPIPVIGVESSPDSLSEMRQDDFYRISECAYYKAEARGFESGHEMEDWLAAEAEIMQ
jgi:hypothetical protein